MPVRYHTRKPKDIIHKGRSVATILEEHQHYLKREKLTGSAELSGADLDGIDLRGLHLGPANLQGAVLSGANLAGSDLQGSNMASVTAEGADFSKVNLTVVNLKDSNLSGSRLSASNLTGANLYGATLASCDLTSASLIRVNLAKAILRRSTLSSALIDGCEFQAAQLQGCAFGNTTIIDSNFADAIGLESTVHGSPSHISLDSLFASETLIPELFLKQAGLPETFITFYPSLNTSPLHIKFHSVFVSYSSKDETFALKLYHDLTARGVKVWIFPEDARWGEPVWSEIDRSIKVFDKLIVVCSTNSLQSTPVLRELERALMREDKEGSNILFPITIDEFIFTAWDHPRKTDVVSKVVGDFRKWRDEESYQKSLIRLHESLSKSERAFGTAKL